MVPIAAVMVPIAMVMVPIAVIMVSITPIVVPAEVGSVMMCIGASAAAVSFTSVWAPPPEVWADFVQR
jgi:hypothetical protein